VGVVQWRNFGCLSIATCCAWRASLYSRADKGKLLRGLGISCMFGVRQLIWVRAVREGSA